MSKLKLFRAILHTGGKSREQIIGLFTCQPTQAEVDLAIAQYNAWDGHECLVMPMGNYWSYCGPASESGRAQAKEAIYLMEQDEIFGCYKNQREEFDHDYESGEYSPDCCFTFTDEDVEILGEFLPEGAAADEA